MSEPGAPKSKLPPEEAKPHGEEPKRALSAEEQMAQFEEDLKETDWGHQPC
jgi:hypothetical protein